MNAATPLRGQASICLPSTPLELFRSLFEMDQFATKYAAPWREWNGWKELRTRLNHFLATNSCAVAWPPVNGTASNDGPTSINACGGHALAERLINGIDGLISLKADEDEGPLPLSPDEAVRKYYNLHENSLAYGVDDMTLREELAKKSVIFRAFVNLNLDPTRKDERDAIYDIRDFGQGILPEDMPNTILSLNRSGKRNKPWLTGKHGQGASNTFQFSTYTLIACRRAGTNKVGFTIVRQDWPEGIRTPTYAYLTIDGQIPTIDAKDVDFPHGVLVRHVGYDNSFSGRQGDASIYGLTNRLLATALLPIWTEVYDSKPGTKGGRSVGPWFCNGHVARGTVNALIRARYLTLNPPAKAQPQRSGKILHDGRATYRIGDLDMGDVTIDGGYVEYFWYVLDHTKVSKKEKETEDRTPQDALKNFVNPKAPILFTLDGQTQAEGERCYITAEDGAGYWAIGKYMIVNVRCDNLHIRAKYALFSSSREHLKRTPLKDRIFKELVTRLSHDDKLKELEATMLNAPAHNDTDKAESFAESFAQYLKDKGIANFPKMLRRVSKDVLSEDGEDGEIKKIKHGRKELAPIPPVDPPTFIRWMNIPPVRMFPGQRYGFRLETDAPNSYYNPNCKAPESRINITWSGPIRCTGGNNMVGGRALINFECAEDAQPGQTATAVALLTWSNTGAPHTTVLQFNVVERPKPNPHPAGPHGGGSGSNGPESSTRIKTKKSGKEYITVETPYLPPQPITRNDEAWGRLEWGADPEFLGFAVHKSGGVYHLWYNAEQPLFLDFLRQATHKGVGELFKLRFEQSLVKHICLALNNELPSEERLSEEEKFRLRAYFCSVLKTLVLEAFTEALQERKSAAQ